MKRLVGISLILAVVVGMIMTGCMSPTGSETTTTGPKQPDVKLRPGPWANCGEGSWVEYKNIIQTKEGLKEVHTKTTVIKVDSDKIVLQHSALTDEGWKDNPSLEESPVKMSEPPKGMSRTELLELKGKKYACEVIARNVQMGNKAAIFRMWMCKDIPGGMVRQEMNERVVFDVVDFEKK